jgi:hypothetical protein
MEILHQGTLKNEAGIEEPFLVRKITINDLHEICNVQSEVFSRLDDRNFLQPLTADEYSFILEGNGLMIGAFAGERMVAFRALLVPLIDEDHLGRDIGLREENLPKVIYQEISNVLPEYRGNKLQRTLAILLMQELNKQEHKYQYVCCTVAPFNIPSLKDKFSQGMEIAALKEKYGGMLRYVFVKDLIMPENRTWREVIHVPMDETAAQQERISEGYRGIGIVNEAGTWLVQYGLA